MRCATPGTGATVVGLQFGALLAGTIVTETIFSWPGIGRLTISAIARRDYFLVQRLHPCHRATYVAVNFLTDLLYSIAQPEDPPVNSAWQLIRRNPLATAGMVLIAIFVSMALLRLDIAARSRPLDLPTRLQRLRMPIGSAPRTWTRHLLTRHLRRPHLDAGWR